MPPRDGTHRTLTIRDVIEFKRRCDEDGVIAAVLRSLDVFVLEPVLDVGSGTGQICARAWGETREVIHLDKLPFDDPLPDTHKRTTGDFLKYEYHPQAGYPKIGTVLFSHVMQYLEGQDAVNHRLKKLNPSTVIIVRNINDGTMGRIVAWAENHGGFNPEFRVPDVPSAEKYRLVATRELSVRVTGHDFDDLTTQVLFLLDPVTTVDDQSRYGLKELLTEELNGRCALDVNQEVLVYMQGAEIRRPESSAYPVALEPGSDNEDIFATHHGSRICGIVDSVMEPREYSAIIEMLVLQGRAGVRSWTWSKGLEGGVDLKKYEQTIRDIFRDDKTPVPSLTGIDNTYFDDFVWQAVVKRHGRATDDPKALDEAAEGTPLASPPTPLREPASESTWVCASFVENTSVTGYDYTARGEGYDWNPGRGKDTAWDEERYRRAFGQYSESIVRLFPATMGVVTTLLIPVALNADHISAREKIGCAIVHLGTRSRPVTILQLERMFTRVRAYWHYHLTGRILSSRSAELATASAERDTAIDEQRLFRLAQAPLATLTQSFEEAQSAAQELRGILYPPYGAFAAAIPGVVGYFTDKATVHVAGEAIGVRHKPSEYMAFDAGVILLSLLAKVFGSNLERYSEIGSLFGHVGGLLYGGKAAHQGVRRICRAIVGGPDDDVWRCVRESVLPPARATDECRVASPVITALRHFKHAMHAPYKYEDSGYTLVPLACSVLVHEGATLELEWRGEVDVFEGLADFLSNADWSDARIWKNGSLPVPRAAFLWAAVGSVVGPGSDVSVSMSRRSVTVANRSSRVGISSDCLRRMHRLVDEKDLRGGFFEGGDETREWYRFAAACLDVKPQLNEEATKLTLAYGDSKMAIRGRDEGVEIRLTAEGTKKGARL